MLLNLTVSSQTVTKSSIINDSIVPLPKMVAREVVKDVLKKDSCEAEIIIQKDNYKKLESISNNKDKIIANRDSLINDYKHKSSNDSLIMVNKDIQKLNLTNIVNDLGKQIKAVKKKATTIEIILGSVAAIFAYIAISK